MRFTIEADADWRVTVTCGETGRAWRRAMRKCPDGLGGLLPFPDTGAAGLPAGGAAEQLRAAYDRIALRRPEAGDIERFGRHLFDALIGAEVWAEMLDEARQDDFVELGLSWQEHPDGHERHLHRLTWEMMRGPARFLVEGVSKAESGVAKTVAVTRLVAGTRHVSGARTKLPPRILFVVGTSLNESQIRPGAEYMALLRQFKYQQLSPLSRVLQRATPQQITEEVKSFRPDVVHFVCHGGKDPETGAGYLSLELDQAERAEGRGEARKRRDAAQLLSMLRDGDRLPAIVVLSACFTGGGHAGRMLGGHDAAPLAAELVKGGVAIVVGMSGQVSDHACRLFTQQFGASLISGQQLVRATGEGRRAAFVGGPPTGESVDWAFPAVFMAEGVAPDYAPVRADATAAARTVAGWVSKYKVDRVPVFCSRNEFFDAYYQSFKPGGPATIVAYTEADEKLWGKTRLLQQLAATALREGHVPLLVTSEINDWQPPRNVGQLCVELLKALGQARGALDLAPAVGSLLLSSLLEVLGRTQHPNIRDRVAGLKSDFGAEPGLLFDKLMALLDTLNVGDVVTHRDVKEALQLDLRRLLGEARARHPEIITAHSRVVVLLDEAHRYDKALDPLFKELLGDYGLGDSPPELVPVVMALSKGTAADEILRDPQDKLRSRIRFLNLPRFADDEFMSVYQQVLLHPFNEHVYPDISARAWVFNYDAPPEVIDKHKGRLYKRLRRIPADFNGDNLRIFYITIEDARDDGFALPADDEARLAALRENK